MDVNGMGATITYPMSERSLPMADNNEGALDAVNACKMSCLGVFYHHTTGEIESAYGHGDGTPVDALVTVFRTGFTRVNCVLAWMTDEGEFLCKATEKRSWIRKEDLTQEDYPPCLYKNKGYGDFSDEV